MSLRVVDNLKIIKITYDYAERIYGLGIDFILKVFLKLYESRLVSRARKAVAPCSLVCN